MHANPTRSLAISLLDRRWFTFAVELVLVIAGILSATVALREALEEQLGQ